MHKVISYTYVPELANRISQDNHLEDLFLEYLRILSSIKDLRRFCISRKEQKSLELISMVALDAFLIETDRKYKIQQLNTQIPELLNSVISRVSKKYRLDKYFSL